MSKSSVELPEIGTVFITKKRGQRTMRLRVDTKGQIQVSMPWLVPKSTAIGFIMTKKDWIIQQQAEHDFKPYNGMLFGKSMRLIIMQHSKTVRAKQVGKDLILYFGGDFDANNPEHVDKVKNAIMKVMRVEAEKILLPRLREIADLYGFSYKSSAIKMVVGRWGSCDSNKHIILNLYLIQLPIELIDYVIIHELAHTVHLNHSSAFWTLVESMCPDYKQIRKQIRGIQPRIYDAKTFMA